jgi:hypothetical protein
MKLEIAPAAAIGVVQGLGHWRAQRVQARQQMTVHPHMVDAHPAPESGKPAVVKIDHRQPSARLQIAPRCFQRLLPAGIDHRQAVGKYDQIKARLPVQRLVIAPLDQLDPLTPRRVGRQLAPGLRQHVRRQIQPVMAASGNWRWRWSKLLPVPQPISRIRRGCESASECTDQRRPPKQKTPAGGVIQPGVPAVVTGQRRSIRRGSAPQTCSERTHATSAKCRLP